MNGVEWTLFRPDRAPSLRRSSRLRRSWFWPPRSSVRAQGGLRPSDRPAVVAEDVAATAAPLLSVAAERPRLQHLNNAII